MINNQTPMLTMKITTSTPEEDKDCISSIERSPNQGSECLLRPTPASTHMQQCFSPGRQGRLPEEDKDGISLIERSPNQGSECLLRPTQPSSSPTNPPEPMRRVGGTDRLVYWDGERKVVNHKVVHKRTTLVELQSSILPYAECPCFIMNKNVHMMGRGKNLQNVLFFARDAIWCIITCFEKEVGFIFKALGQCFFPRSSPPQMSLFDMDKEMGFYVQQVNGPPLGRFKNRGTSHIHLFLVTNSLSVCHHLALTSSTIQQLLCQKPVSAYSVPHTRTRGKKHKKVTVVYVLDTPERLKMQPSNCYQVQLDGPIVKTQR